MIFNLIMNWANIGVKFLDKCEGALTNVEKTFLNTALYHHHTLVYYEFCSTNILEKLLNSVWRLYVILMVGMRM